MGPHILVGSKKLLSKSKSFSAQKVQTIPQDTLQQSIQYSNNHSCIACGFAISYQLYKPEEQPLAALHLPRTHEEAQTVLTYPMNFRCCAYCGHVWNVDFDYHRVPYEDNSNLMYNGATLWRKRMVSLVDKLAITYKIENKTLIDIGCGDGGFLKLFIDEGLKNRYIGFEPGIEAENAKINGLEVYKDYFHPSKDIKRFNPDFLICRHVIEHLQKPKDFVAEIAYCCSMYDTYPIFIAEVPRIDKAIATARVNDYLYEHVSNFTEYSFQRMFEVSGFEVLDLFSDYFDEVTVAVVRAKKIERIQDIKSLARHCSYNITRQKSHVDKTLNTLLLDGKKIAFWGGTGKGASFLNAFDILDENYPIVVDSDNNKVGRYVPRTAQLIRPPEFLKQHPVDIIVITTQWRAKDIYLEIKARDIPFEQVLVMSNMSLSNYNGEDL